MNIQVISEKVFSVLKGFGYMLTIYDFNGKRTYVPKDGAFFYIDQPDIVVRVSVDEGILLSKSSETKYSDIEKLVNQLKNVANRYMMEFNIRSYAKHITPKDFAYQVGKSKSEVDRIVEGFTKLYGTKKYSYQVLEDIKIVLKHSIDICEKVKGARSRNIVDIYLVNSKGERTRFPVLHLNGARAMARHLSVGGDTTDAIGEYIIDSSRKHKKLKEFIHYSKRNKLINENTNDVIELAFETIDTIAERLKRLSGAKSYGEVRSLIENELAADLEVDANLIEELTDKFTVKYFDESLSDTIQLLGKSVQKRKTFFEEMDKVLTDGCAFDDISRVLDSTLIFEDQYAELSTRLSFLSDSAKQDVLKTFLSNISEKVLKRVKLDEYELSTMQRIFDSLTCR